MVIKSYLAVEADAAFNILSVEIMTRSNVELHVLYEAYLQTHMYVI